VASAIFVSIGRFAFQFGIATFILATLMSIVLTSLGFPIHPAMARMSALLPIVGLTSIILGALGKVSGVVSVFMPRLGKLAGVTVYLSLFLPAVSGITTVVLAVLSSLPIPPTASMALQSVVSTLLGASIAYYLAVKLGIMPPE